MKTEFKNLIYFWIAIFGSTVFGLTAAENLIFKSTSPFLSRPIYTNPCIDQAFGKEIPFSVSLIAGTTLPFLEKNKSIFDTTINRQVTKELYDLSQSTILLDGDSIFMPENRKLVSRAFSDLLDIFGKLTTEHHRAGVVLNGSLKLDHGQTEKDFNECVTLSASLPIVFRVGHLYLSLADQRRFKGLLKKIGNAFKEDDNSIYDQLFISDKLKSDFFSTVISKKFGFEELKFDIFSPILRNKYDFGLRVGLESIIDFDQFNERTDLSSQKININRKELYEFKSSGDRQEDWRSLFVLRIVGGQKMDMLGVSDILYALVNSRVKPQLDGWGHAIGLVVDADYDLVEGKIKVFSRLRNDLFFGLTKKAVILIDDFLEPSEFDVQTGPTLLSQFNIGADIAFNRWNLKVGYDFMFRTAESIDLIYDSYRNPNFLSINSSDSDGNQTYEYRGGLDYDAFGRMQVKLAQMPRAWQHRLYFVMSRDFGQAKNLVFNFGGDIALISEFMPRNLNLSLGLGYKF